MATHDARLYNVNMTSCLLLLLGSVLKLTGTVPSASVPRAARSVSTPWSLSVPSTDCRRTSRNSKAVTDKIR